MPKPAFDPSKPFDEAPKPEFDPSKPFESAAPRKEPLTLGSALEKGSNYLSEVAGGLTAGSQQAIPFSNLVDKAGAASYAAQQELFDLFRPEAERKDFKDRYKETLNQTKTERAEAIKKAPVAGGIGELIGAGTSLAIPIPGAGAAGVGGAAARIAGSAGLSALERGTSGEDLFDPKLAQQGATVAGGIQTAAEAIPVVGKFAAPALTTLKNASEKTGEYLESIANNRGVKAALGNSAKAYKDLGENRIQSTGEKLLSGFEDIPAVIAAGDTAKNIQKKASEAGGETWAKITDIHNQADAENVLINGKEVAEKILARAAKIEDVPQNLPRIEELQKQALYYENKGFLTLSEAQNLKNNYEWKRVNKLQDVLGKDGNNSVKNAIGDSMKDAIAQSDVVGKESYPELLKRYGAYATAEKGAADTAIKQSKNRSISLTDYIAGGAGGVVGGALGGDPQDAALSAGLVGFANNLARTRGNATLAVTANALAKVAENAPQVIHKYADVLNNALKNGSASFSLTHAMLMQKDPQYKKAVEDATPNAFQRRLDNSKGTP